MTIKTSNFKVQIKNNMDIHSEKELLIKEINQVEDLALLKALKSLLHYGLQKDGRISIEQYNRELDEAELEIDRGDFITHEELKKQMKEW